MNMPETRADLRKMLKAQLVEFALQHALAVERLEYEIRGLKQRQGQDLEAIQKYAQANRELRSEVEWFRRESNTLRANAKLLVEHLGDAWWVKATIALHTLQAVLQESGEMPSSDVPF